ncbi:MAG: hypothetical protein VW397_02980 [Candidatus Margulisiibacteriota bacterium]
MNASAPLIDHRVIAMSQNFKQVNVELLGKLNALLQPKLNSHDVKEIALFIETKYWNQALFFNGLKHILSIIPNGTPPKIEFRKSSLYIFGYKYKEHSDVKGFYKSKLNQLDHCKAYVQKIMLRDYTVVYTGAWDKCPNGRGQINYGIGDFATGEFEDGRMIRGKVIFHSTQEFRFQRNERFIQKGNESYEGSLKPTSYFGYEVFHGYGKYTFKNGDYFEGEWVDHLPNGIGKLTLNDGKTFEGNWINGYFNNGSEDHLNSTSQIYFNRVPKQHVGSKKLEDYWKKLPIELVCYDPFSENYSRAIDVT